ncbi:serine/threonine protein phosphatase [Brevibacillus ruminantium]|uniref:Serine/threonine protein phosphatase n=1 Tax=Brevibacillus ruminantium TaxID=2950604 RepID=A0ABY4WI78_9BACL|nr:metallophosphoesterase family protein [Brevibacillus ruminantium]USG66753.1 serine/threonine protein phosphatase [Brevibacillus ruminantium]
MRVLAISDIHGMYDEFCELLAFISFSPDTDRLILLGDYIDRGPKSKEVVQKVKQLVTQYNAVAIRGNHDEMFLDFLLQSDQEKTDRYLRNGGRATIEAYCGQDWFSEGITDESIQRAKGYIREHYAEDISFLQQLPYYYETETHIFVHAGVNPAYENWKDTPPYEMIWIRDPFYHHPTREKRTVVFGHTTCSTLHEKPEIWFGEGKIGIDGGCTFGSQLNCLEILPDGYQVYAVQTKNKPALSDVSV